MSNHKTITDSACKPSKKKQVEQQYENILVGIRLRPTDANEKICSIMNEKSVMVRKTNESFQFDQVFDEASNSKHIFNSIIKPIVGKCLQGYNGSICAYGQTSSGKTYTMKGSQNEPGVIQLSLDYLFQQINKLSEIYCQVKISYIEIYNENVYDLLNKDFQDMKPLSFNEYKWEPISNLKEFEEIFKYGEEQRHFGETKMNDNSSRSHVILQMIIETRLKVPPFTTRTSQLHLVDLAGSEALSKTLSEGLRRKEGFSINKSLLALQSVVIKLKENKKDQFVNFRDSKLTQILKPSLSGNSITLFLLTISQNQENYQESINTMRFGMAAGALKNSVKVNETSESTNLQIEYCNGINEQLELLKKQVEDKQLEIICLSDQLDILQARNDELQDVITDKDKLVAHQQQQLQDKNAQNTELWDKVDFLTKQNQELGDASNENFRLLQQYIKLIDEKGVLTTKLQYDCITQTDNDDEMIKHQEILEQENQKLKEQLTQMQCQFQTEIQELKGVTNNYNKNRDQTPLKKYRFQPTKDMNEEFGRDAKSLIQMSIQKNNQYLEALMQQTSLQTQLIEQTKQNMILRNLLDRKEKEYVELERANFKLHQSIFDLQERVSNNNPIEGKENFWDQNKQGLESEKSIKNGSFKKIRQKLVQSPSKDELKRNLFRIEQKNQVYEKEMKKYLRNLDRISKEKQELQQFSHHLYLACIEHNIPLQ